MTRRDAILDFAGHLLVARTSGALWWPDQRLLVFADLHFEKGSYFARRGQLLPPYDTRETLLRMTAEIDRLNPRQIVCLGDSFHDLEAWARMQPEDAALLAALAHRRDWLWVAGNHDADLPRDLPGDVTSEFVCEGMTLRHRALIHATSGEVSGHFHPKISVRAAGRSVVRRCFVEDGRRLVLPAFGAYTGGLDAGDPAFAAIFPDGYIAHVLGSSGVYSLARRHAGAV